MKKKFTQFRWFAAMIMLMAAMVMPSTAWAQTMYTVFDTSSGTLTFKYDSSKPSDTENVYDVPTNSDMPGWKIPHRLDIKKVVFDASFVDARPTKCYSWFDGCRQLTAIQGLEYLNTSKVTDMDYMFHNCSSLTFLDLSSFDTQNVFYMGDMFSNCNNLQTIFVSDKFVTNRVTSSPYMFLGCTSLEGGVAYSSENANDVTYANCTTGYFTHVSNKVNFGFHAVYNSSSQRLTFKYGNKTKLNTEGTAYELNTGKTAPGWINNTGITKVVFEMSFANALPTSCFQWFNGLSSLTTIEGIGYLNTSEVTDMNEMFNSCSGLKNLDLSSFNTAKVTDMGYMFGGCYDLISLDLSSFNTAKVTDMTWMFYNCQSLTTIYASDGFTTGEVSSSDGMFESCFVLEGATPWDITKTDKSMANFDGYFTPKNITPYVKWDASTKVLTFKVANDKEAGSGVYDLNKGANTPGWFIDEVKNNCTKVVFTPSFNHAKPTSCYQWFYGFNSLTTIDGIENLNTAKVTNMSSMFNGCWVLTSLDLSKFNTAGVMDMNFMFANCLKLTSLDLSSFNTAKVENMSGMFNYCIGLKSLDLSSFNTAKVENMSYMFQKCRGLTSLDLSSFNTAEVTNMNCMFFNCESLTKIYVSDDFATGNVSSSMDMFGDCSQLVGAASYDSNKTDHTMGNYKTGYFKTYFTLGENKVELCGETLTTASLDLTGDKDFVAHAPFKANTATYSRDLSSSGASWFSLCLPFAYTPNNFNFTAYQLKGASADAVEIEEMTGEIAAGTPVLFKFKDGEEKKINISETDAQILKAPVVGTAVNGPEGSLQLCGTYQTKTFSSVDGNAFILLNDKLMNPAKMLDKGVTKVGVKPFRAYMTLTASAGATSAPASARAFSIGRAGEGNEGTTAIDLLNSVATDDAEYYDINGRRIDAPVKGVNIVRRGNKTIKLIIK